jgi:toluene monooxygenase system protein E
MTLSNERTRRARSKTWSRLGETRRKPSEYEIVTHGLHYHYKRDPVPFELDPRAPLNRWYLKHREGSTFQVDDWEDFRDPTKLTYRGYVGVQRARETYLDSLIDGFEVRDHYANADAAWVQTLDRLYLPTRYSGHVLQMTSVYVSQMAPTSYITVAYHFQGGDEMRRVQRNAYLAKAYSLDHSAELADSAHTRSIWEQDEHWQPLRELLEKLMVAYDWGEAFAALSLVVKPAYDALFNEQLAQLARANGDELLASLADDFRLDEARHQDTARAVVAYAVERSPELSGVLREWVAKWQSPTDAAIAGLSELFATAPFAVDPLAVVSAVSAGRRTFLTECGLA